MQLVEAIFQDGVFKPLQDVALSDQARVRLKVELLPPLEVQEWLRKAQELRDQLFAQHGYFPDSALDIAEDRRR